MKLIKEEIKLKLWLIELYPQLYCLWKSKTTNLPSRALSDNDRASMLTRPLTIRIDEQSRQNIQLTGNNWIDSILFTDSFIQNRTECSVLKSWDALQYSLQCPFYTYLNDWCCQLYFLNLNSHTRISICACPCACEKERELPASQHEQGVNFFSNGKAVAVKCVRSHISWREKRNILYKGVETSP